MGNNLSGLTPNASVNVEQVLADYDDWSHEHLLGSSRFFKVSKIRMKKERKYGVLKVFKYPESTKTVVDKYLKLMQYYCTNNSPNLNNVMSYKKCFINKDVAFLLRDFSDYSLTVRMRTRPFLTLEEKKWIAFQILCGLTQCHKERLASHCSETTKLSNHEVRLCHGDLKTENIMLTDWGWVFLADMAPFKPVYLPSNNPSEFYFYFNISGKDHPTCYLAPERFVDWTSAQISVPDTGTKSTGSKKTESSEADSFDGISPNIPIDLTDQSKHILQPSMDMFSVGCIFIELFTDGIIPFDLENLLKYRNRDLSKLNSILQKIHNTNIQDMIKQLLHLSPQERITAEECLISQRGKSFPDVFYRDLKGYMVQFLDENMHDPDKRIRKLYMDFPELMKTYLPYPKRRHVKNETLILFVNFITASIFLIEEEQNKINSLVMLKELGLYMTDDLVLDRIVPFLLEFIGTDNSTEVRQTALDCVVLSVREINSTNPADISFFPDYLLPLISELQKDNSVSIRYTFARHIPCLAKTAQRFLINCVKLQKSIQKSKEKITINYESELSHLRELFRDMIINLFAEEDVQIKCYVSQTKYLHDLAEFFSINKAIEILLSHLITFLNDKVNYTVRSSFYKCVPEVVRIMGIQSLTLIKSLLYQGLQDSNLQVVEICCHSLAKMIRLNLMPDWLKSDLFPHVVALFTLPYNSLRLTSLDYTISFCTHSSLATVYSSFLKCDEYECIFKLKEPLCIERNMESIIWANLKPPINREIFENIIRNSEATELISFLKLRQKTNGEVSNLFRTGNISLNYHFKKLQELGLTLNEESQILLLSKLINEIVISKRPLQSVDNKKNKPNANVSAFNSKISYFNYKSNASNNMKEPFSEALGTIEFEILVNQESFGGRPSTFSSRPPIQKPVKDNTWTNLFDNEPLTLSTSDNINDLKLNFYDDESNSMEISKSDVIETPFKKSENSNFMSYIYKGLSSGSSYVYNEQASKNNHYYLPTAWKPSGILVGHLHEHRRGYTSILAHPTEKQMISCGTDKTIKIWNCDSNPSKPDATCSKYLPNKSSFSVNLDDSSKSHIVGSCQNLVWTENYNSVAAVVDRKYVHIVDRIGEKKEIFDFPTDEYGFINSLTTPLESGCELDLSSQRTLIYSTTGNWIVAHDIRCPNPVRSIWCYKQDNDLGFITCMAVHSSHTWMVTGTSRGSLVCWDLRFQRVVNQMDHPKRSGFLSVKINPLSSETSDNCAIRSAQIWAATEEFNEISSWNLESSCRITSLRTSLPEITQEPSPEMSSIQRQTSTNYLHNNNYNSKSFLVRLIGSVEQRPCIISGSSDCNLRFWDIKEPNESSIFSVGGLDQYSAKASIKYSLYRDDSNVDVHEEKQSIAYINESISKKPDFQSFTGHVANICDVTTIMLGQPFIVSSSMDGVIKIWK